MHRFSPPLVIAKCPAIPPTDPDRQRALDAALTSLGRATGLVLPAGATFEMIAPSLRSFAARTGLGWTGEPYLRIAGVDTAPRPGLDRPTVYELMTEQLRKRDLRLLSGPPPRERPRVGAHVEDNPQSVRVVENDPAYWAEYFGRTVRIEAAKYGVPETTICAWFAHPASRALLLAAESTAEEIALAQGGAS